MERPEVMTRTKTSALGKISYFQINSLFLDRRVVGFTLLEMLVVLVILGIFFSSISPNITRSEKRVIYQETAKLSALLRAAREEAILRNTLVKCTITGASYDFAYLANNIWTPIKNHQHLKKREFSITNLIISAPPALQTDGAIEIVFGREPVGTSFNIKVSKANNESTIIASGLGHFHVR